MKKSIFLLMISLCFSGCTQVNSPKQVSASPSNVAKNTSTHVFVYEDGSLKQIDLISGATITSTQIPAGLTPINFLFNKTFQINTEKTYVVWFVPGKGLVRWKNVDHSISVFYVPTEWFYENPFFQFNGATNTVVLIDKKGSEVVWVDLDTGKQSTFPVPYPFGTVFALSPDHQKIIYVEGYRQTTDTPTYLVTSTSGQMLKEFKTNADIANRTFVAWLPDSSGIMTVENNYQLVKYTLDHPDQSEISLQLPSDETISDFEPEGNWLFLTTQKSWYLIDLTTNQVVKRLPLAVASALNQPRMIPLDQYHFYIEEDVLAFNQTYKRLWLSDWTGNRTLMIPEYGIKVEQTD